MSTPHKPNVSKPVSSQQPVEPPLSDFKNYLKFRWSLVTKRERIYLAILTAGNLAMFLILLLGAGGGFFSCLLFFLMWELIFTGYYLLKHRRLVKSAWREWTDAIAFAVIAATVLKALFFEMYTIPTSSMENSLLRGDFLIVNKMTYGMRTPMTGISFPFAHHTMPIGTMPAYLRWLEFPYYRLPGLKSIERGDVVVFNYPAEVVDEYVNGKLSPYIRPVDKKENYIKRCVAQAGDTLRIIATEVYTNGVALPHPERMQHAWIIYAPEYDPQILLRALEKLEVTEVMGYTRPGEYKIMIKDKRVPELKNLPGIQKMMPELATGSEPGIFPTNSHPDDTLFNGWNRDNFGPLYLPKAGDNIVMNERNYKLYDQAIRVYENNPSLEWKDGQAWLNGQPLASYTFKMNYYFMMGDNRHNSLDSRYWGMVPEDHIIGKASLVWLSLDPAKKLSEKVRWDRMFRTIK